MEYCSRTISQGQPSPPDGDKLIQWESLPDPLRIERECAEVLRLASRVNTSTNVTQNTVKNCEISQVIDDQCEHTECTSQSGEISPNIKR